MWDTEKGLVAFLMGWCEGEGICFMTLLSITLGTYYEWMEFLRGDEI